MGRVQNTINHPIHEFEVDRGEDFSNSGSTKTHFAPSKHDFDPPQPRSGPLGHLSGPPRPSTHPKYQGIAQAL